MDAVRRHIPNYDFLEEQSRRYAAYTSSDGRRQEIALLYTDEDGRLRYAPTPEELDARVKIAQSPYANYMGADGAMQMIALVDDNGRYIPSPLDGGITTREATLSQSNRPNKNLLADFERPNWAGAHQARHDDQEPQGARVASGQEATVVAQR